MLWLYPDIADSPTPQLVSQRDGVTGLFTSLLTVIDVKSSSSGSYSCYYSIFKDELNDELKRSAHIYVTSKGEIYSITIHESVCLSYVLCCLSASSDYLVVHVIISFMQLIDNNGPRSDP